MPPKGSHKLATTPAQAKASGNALVSRWFTPAPQPSKPGRPCLPFKKRGPKPVVSRPVTDGLLYADVVKAPSAVPPTVPAPIKRKRLNWSKGDALERLSQAKEDWLNKTGDLLSANPDMSMYEFSKRVRIPSSTLHSYAHANASQRQRLGSSAGKPAIVNDETAQFAVDVLRRRDRVNDGMHHRERRSTWCTT